MDAESDTSESEEEPRRNRRFGAETSFDGNMATLASSEISAPELEG